MSQPQADPRALLAEAVWNDPEVGPAFQEIVHKKFPQAQIPGIQAKNAAEATVKPLAEEISKLRGELTKRDQDAAREASRLEVMNDPELRIAREELPAVEDIMTKEMVGSHRVAAEVFRARQQNTAQPGSPFDYGLQVPGHMGAGGDDYKGIIEDRTGWRRNRINQIMTDFRRDPQGAAIKYA